MPNPHGMAWLQSARRPEDDDNEEAQPQRAVHPGSTLRSALLYPYAVGTIDQALPACSREAQLVRLFGLCKVGP